MESTDIMDFTKIMCTLSEVYGDGRPPSDLKNEVYFSALKQYDIGTLKRGIERMVMTRVFPSFPKPGEIVHEIDGSKEERGVSAWGKVVDAIRRVGPYQSVSFDDPIIHAVIDFMGGWPATGDWLEEELKWKQKEFERLYSIMEARGSDKKYLPGIHEMTNDATQRPVSPPVFIGQAEGQKMIEAAHG
jgi:hypothetical protein